MQYRKVFKKLVNKSAAKNKLEALEGGMGLPQQLPVFPKIALRASDML